MAKKSKDPGEATEGDDEKKGPLGGKLKLVAMILPAILLIAGAAYFFLLKPSASTPLSAAAIASASASEAAVLKDDKGVAYVAGALVVVDSITVNLANGHYLQVSLALQATAAAGTELTGSKAMDATITEFSGKTVAELATKTGREAARKELTKAIKEAYEGEVYEVFFTTFVMN